MEFGTSRFTNKISNISLFIKPMLHEFHEICQENLSFEPWVNEKTRRLPGINPLEPRDWLFRDDAFDRQMRYRDHLIKTKRDLVFDCTGEGDRIAEELLRTICETLQDVEDYIWGKGYVTRPDGQIIELNDDHPLIVAGRLVQEDLCLLHNGGDQHVLVGAILCFPASWLLSEKMGLPLTSIHDPVPQYNDRIAMVVQRMFDNLQPDRIIYRGNYLSYTNPDLHQPRSMNQRRDKDKTGKKWARVERQTLRKLNETKGVVFGIHTSVCPQDNLSDPGEFENYLAEKED
ncbi:MAG: DUF3445 domain-containing protein [Rhodobacteraceae bacterium]|nr:DUF3445 domain-containing protein [Paracoccaceae bacterium]